jgi:hypothetical protein
MKPTMAIKPLVFALAAVMAVAAHSEGRGDKDRHDHDPSPVVAAGSTAAVIDAQNSYGNMTLNQGTQDSAKVDASGSNSNGNLGINAAAGSANQQDNAAAIATADQAFIFGSAAAATGAIQNNNNNATSNWGSHTTSTLSNSSNTSSGNIGINVTSGDYNQQKNNLAIAVSGGHVAVAGAAANQTSNNTTVSNYADRTYTTTTLKSTLAVTGSYKGTGTGTVADNDNRRDRDDRNNTNKLAFTESGTVELSGVATWQVMTPSGWANPVMNSATLSNSLNNVSGNVGANVSAGTGNQQSNSLAIAAGCKTCM